MNEIKSLRDVRDRLDKLLDRLEQRASSHITEKPFVVEASPNWRAEYGERYYTLSSDGYVVLCTEKLEFPDNYRYVTMNYAPTTNEGRIYLERRSTRELAIGRVTRALRRAEQELGAEPVEWRDCIQRKFYPELRHFAGDDMRGEITVQSVVVVQNPLSVPYSTSKEAWKHVIKSHEDDLRIIMEVER